MKKFTLFILGCIASLSGFSQGGLIMNADVYLTFGTAGGTYVVVDNATNAITQRNAGGRIISEKETNYIRWHVGTSTGVTDTIPFFDEVTGDNRNPLIIAVTSAGSPALAGNIDFSTYDAQSAGIAAGSYYDNSLYMPTGVTNMSTAGGASYIANNSSNVTDRFWIIDATHTTTEPAVTLSFTYIDAENTSTSNTIGTASTALKAQRWNSSLATPDWDGYVGFPPAGTSNGLTPTGIVSGVAVTAGNLYRAWTLVDPDDGPLPISLLSNEVNCRDNNVDMTWSTASETNNDFFTIEKSTDGSTFYAVGTVPGAGTSSSITNYSYRDKNTSSGTGYYRLRQTDYNGNSEIYNILTIENCNTNPFSVNAYHSENGYIAIEINTQNTDDFTATVYDNLGKQISTSALQTTEKGKNIYELDIRAVDAGIYYISIQNKTDRIVKKLIAVR